MENSQIEEPDYLDGRYDYMSTVIEMPAAVEQPKPTVVQAAECPGCGNQAEENDLGFAPPITLQLRSCGHYSCNSCSRNCSDPECSNTECSDCICICEGHAEPWCRDHVIAKNYCAECAPAAELEACRRPSYVYEAD